MGKTGGRRQIPGDSCWIPWQRQVCAAPVPQGGISSWCESSEIVTPGLAAAGFRHFPCGDSQTHWLPLLSDVCAVFILVYTETKRTRVGNVVFRWVGRFVYFYTYTVWLMKRVTVWDCGSAAPGFSQQCCMSAWPGSVSGFTSISDELFKGIKGHELCP